MKKIKDEIKQYHHCKNCKAAIDHKDNLCKRCSEIYVPCSWCKEEYRLEKIEKTSTGVYLCSECWGNAPR